MFGRKQIFSLRRGLPEKSLTASIRFYATCCLFISALFLLHYGQHLWLQQQQFGAQYNESTETLSIENTGQINELRGISSRLAFLTKKIENDRARVTSTSKIWSLNTDNNVTTTSSPTQTVTTRITAIASQNTSKTSEPIKLSVKLLKPSSRETASPIPQIVKTGQSAAINESFDRIFAQQQRSRIALNESRIKAAQALKERNAKLRQLAEEKQRVAAMIKSLNTTGLRELVEVLLNKFDDDEIISVRGFYSSGTNWLRSLLLHNCKNMTFERSMHPPLESDFKLDADGVFGWKHGLFLEREITRLASRKRQKLVIISREAPTWVVSAWKMYAMANAARRSPSLSQPNTGKVATGAFGNFSRYINDNKVRETSIYSRYLEMYYDIGHRAQYRIEGDNVFEARTKVYRNWMTLLRNESISNQVYFMRYEDLLDDPYSIFRQLIQHLNVSKCTVTSPETFDPVNSYVKYHVEHKRTSFKGRHPRKEFCITIKSQAIYDSILAKIDRVFEAQVLRYTYPAKLEEYCKGVVPPEELLNNKPTTPTTITVNSQSSRQRVNRG